MTDAVLYEKQGNVAILTFNEPEALNPLSTERWLGLLQGMEKANADDDIGAIIITGAGRAFCAGADIGKTFLPKLNGDEEYEADDHRLGGLGLPFDWLQIARESKPLIAAVNGIAVGVGATCILPCDIIIADEDAQFGYLFAKMGITPELGSSYYLQARVGFTAASELVMTGRLIKADEALRIGLVNRVVPNEELLATAIKTAKAVTANPTNALQRAKRLLDANREESDANAIWQKESDALRESFAQPEHKEAVYAFLEKRKPDFKKLNN